MLPNDHLSEEALRIFTENSHFFILPLMDQEKYDRDVIKQIPEMKKIAAEFDHVFTKIVQNEMLDGIGVPQDVDLTAADFYKKVYKKRGVVFEIGKEVAKRIMALKLQYVTAIIGLHNQPDGLLKGNSSMLANFLKQHPEFVDFILDNSEKLVSAAQTWASNLNAGELQALETTWGYMDVVTRNRNLLTQALLRENILMPLKNARYSFPTKEEEEKYVTVVSSYLQQLNVNEPFDKFYHKINYILQRNAEIVFNQYRAAQNPNVFNQNRAAQNPNIAVLQRASDPKNIIQFAASNGLKFSNIQNATPFLNNVIGQLNNINLQLHPQQYQETLHNVLKNNVYYIIKIQDMLEARIRDEELPYAVLQPQFDNLKNDLQLFNKVSNKTRQVSLQNASYETLLLDAIADGIFEYLDGKLEELSINDNAIYETSTQKPTTLFSHPKGTSLGNNNKNENLSSGNIKTEPKGKK